MTVELVVNEMGRPMCLKKIHAHEGLADCFREMGARTLVMTLVIAQTTASVPATA